MELKQTGKPFKKTYLYFMLKLATGVNILHRNNFLFANFSFSVFSLINVNGKIFTPAL